MANKEYDRFTDEELIIMMHAGEDKVSDYLMEKYMPLVRIRARALYLKGGDREDLLQEGMIGLFKAIRDYDPDKKAAFNTFATICITNQMLTAIEASKRKKNSVLNNSVSLNGIGEHENNEALLLSDSPEKQFIEKEALNDLKKRIKEVLSPLENRVFDLFIEGKSYKEIGEILGKEEKSVDNALQRIKVKVKRVHLEPA